MTVAVRNCDIRDVINRAPPIFLVQGEWHKIVIDFVFSYRGMESLCTLWLAREMELGEGTGAEHGFFGCKRPKQVAETLGLTWTGTTCPG